ncbi:hypothetical protein GCM10025865_02550 [Paraoerskovia sediminicola]|uniref:Uncharacterized protein n=1 Tax=Paraoerskovia sediminicola TaxID=1138587 RepID=A0ABN6X8D4_9CELL|nr:hypothetical protein GCM10025865_02550 [Paraoerskovia sediminicola]
MVSQDRGKRARGTYVSFVGLVSPYPRCTEPVLVAVAIRAGGGCAEIAWVRGRDRLFGATPTGPIMV